MSYSTGLEQYTQAMKYRNYRTCKLVYRENKKSNCLDLLQCLESRNLSIAYCFLPTLQFRVLVYLETRLWADSDQSKSDVW